MYTAVIQFGHMTHEMWGLEKYNLGLVFLLDSWPIKLKLFKPKGVLSNTSNCDQFVGTNEMKLTYMYAPVSAYTFTIRCSATKGHVFRQILSRRPEPGGSLGGAWGQDGRDNLANVRREFVLEHSRQVNEHRYVAILLVENHRKKKKKI